MNLIPLSPRAAARRLLLLAAGVIVAVLVPMTYAAAATEHAPILGHPDSGAVGSYRVEDRLVYSSRPIDTGAPLQLQLAEQVGPAALDVGNEELRAINWAISTRGQSDDPVVVSAVALFVWWQLTVSEPQYPAWQEALLLRRLADHERREVLVELAKLRRQARLVVEAQPLRGELLLRVDPAEPSRGVIVLRSNDIGATAAVSLQGARFGDGGTTATLRVGAAVSVQLETGAEVGTGRSAQASAVVTASAESWLPTVTVFSAPGTQLLGGTGGHRHELSITTTAHWTSESGAEVSRFSTVGSADRAQATSTTVPEQTATTGSQEARHPDGGHAAADDSAAPDAASTPEADVEAELGVEHGTSPDADADADADAGIVTTARPEATSAPATPVEPESSAEPTGSGASGPAAATDVTEEADTPAEAEASGGADTANRTDVPGAATTTPAPEATAEPTATAQVESAPAPEPTPTSTATIGSPAIGSPSSTEPGTTETGPATAAAPRLAETGAGSAAPALLTAGVLLALGSLLLARRWLRRGGGRSGRPAGGVRN